MVTSRAERRAAREAQAREHFGPDAAAALDLLELVELAWHDCYAEPSPPDQVIEDIWTGARGDLTQLVHAAHLAVVDFRDLHVNATKVRSHE